VSKIVERTLQVGPDGSVVFRAALGKGSGRPVTIPGDQFDQFVSLMNETALKREAKAELARANEAKDVPATED